MWDIHVGCVFIKHVYVWLGREVLVLTGLVYGLPSLTDGATYPEPGGVTEQFWGYSP